MTNILWVDILIVAATLVTAVGVLWKKFFKPLLKALDVAAEALPVLLDIAREFQPNHGSSMRDTINIIQSGMERIELKADTANELAKRVAAEAQLGRSMVENLGNEIAQVGTHLERFNELHEK